MQIQEQNSKIDIKFWNGISLKKKMEEWKETELSDLEYCNYYTKNFKLEFQRRDIVLNEKHDKIDGVLRYLEIEKFGENVRISEYFLNHNADRILIYEEEKKNLTEEEQEFLFELFRKIVKKFL